MLLVGNERVYTSKHKPLCTCFLHTIKPSGHRIRERFDKEALAVEQNNFVTRITNAYIVYDLEEFLLTTLNYKIPCLMQLIL